MDAIQRIEFRFRGVKKSHAAGVAGIIDQIIKFIGAQLRQRALKALTNASKVSISPALKGNAIARAPSASTRVTTSFASARRVL